MEEKGADSPLKRLTRVERRTKRGDERSAARPSKRYSLVIMKRLRFSGQGQGRRDWIWVGGATVLALLPLLVLWRKSVVSASPNAMSGAALGGLSPVLPPVPAGQPNSYFDITTKLSPDGRFLARMENPNGQPPATNASPSDVVIRTTGGNEVFRASASQTDLRWVGSSLVALQSQNDFATIFSPASSGSGSGAAPAYNQMQRSVPSGQGDAFSGANRLVLAPDGSLMAQARKNNGALRWSVVDMVSGATVANDVEAGTMSDNDFSSDMAFGVAPLATKWPSGIVGPVVVVSRCLPRPIPSPTPTPKPVPTPTISPAQTEFLKRERQEEARLQPLIDSVLGENGEEPKETDPDRVAQIEAQVKARQHVLSVERKRLFPIKPTPTPTPVTLQGQTRVCRVECFDLGGGRSLWQTAVRVGMGGTPHPLFSPDGTRLVLPGVARLRQDGGSPSVWDSGMEVFAPATGRILASWTFGTTNLLWGDSPPVYFLSSPPRLTVLDTSRTTVLRFFDLASLQETSYASLRSGMPSQISPDASGSQWVAHQGGNTFLLALSTLGQEHPGPLPTPAPSAPWN